MKVKEAFFGFLAFIRKWTRPAPRAWLTASACRWTAKFWMIVSGCLGIGLAVASSLFWVISHGIAVTPNLRYTGLFQVIYEARYVGMETPVQMFAEGFLYLTLLFTLFMMIGYFIGAAYYRMSKPVKIAVSIGVPTFFLLALPVLDFVVLNEKLYSVAREMIRVTSGMKFGANPYYAMISMLLCTAVFGGGSWLLLRRASLKAG